MGHRICIFVDCLAGEQSIFAWCWRWDRSVAINVAGIVAAGRGDETMIGRRWRRTGCGQIGTITVHQPSRTDGFWGR